LNFVSYWSGCYANATNVDASTRPAELACGAAGRYIFPPAMSHVVRTSLSVITAICHLTHHTSLGFG